MTSFTAMGDRLYSVELRYEGPAANTYALAIETRSTSDGGLVGSVSIPSFSATGAIVNLLPIAGGGALVVHADDGLNLVATRADGSLRWRQRMDRIDDPVLATSRDGGRIALGGTLVAEPATVRVHALDLQSGSLLASADFAGVGARARLDLDATDTGWVLARSRTEGLNRLRLAHDLAVQVDHQANGAVFLELASGATLVDDRLLVAREIATGGGRTIQVQAISPTDGAVLQDVVLQPMPLSAETRITQLFLTRFADGLGLHVPVARPWGEGPCPSLVQTHVLMLEPDTLQERWRSSMFEPAPTYLRGRTGGSLYLIGTNRDPANCAALQSNVLSAWMPGTGSIRWSETTPQARFYLQDWPGQVLTTVDLGAQSEYELVMRSAVDGSAQWRSLVQNQDYPITALDVQSGRVHTQEISAWGSTLALAARSLVDGQQSFRTVVDLAPDFPYFSVLRATSDGRLLNIATRSALRGQLRDASPYISVVNADDGAVIRTLDPGRLQGADWTLYPITRADGRVPARSLAISGVRSPHPVAHRVTSLAIVDLDSGAIGGDRMLLRTTLPDYAPASGWARIDQYTELTDGSLLLVGVRYDALGVPRRAAARIQVAPVPSTNIRVQFPGGSPSTLGYDYVMDSVVTNTGIVRVDGVRLWSAPSDLVDGSLDIVGCSLNGAGSCPEPGAWNGASLSLDVQSSMTLRVRYQCTSCTSGMPRDLRAVEFSATTPFGVAETDRADHLGRQLVTFGPFDSGFE